MFFVNQRLRVLPDEPATPEEFSGLPPQVRLKVRDAFLKHTDLIESFVDENPAHLSDDELDIVRSWRHLVAGKFYVFRELKKYTVFLSATDPAIAYGVLALSQPFEELIGPYLPVLTQTVLLPFKGMIVYDGLMSSYNISFGPGIRRNLNEDFKEAKARHGIVTSLPMSDEPLPPKAPKPRPVPKPPSREEKDEALQCRHRIDRPVLQRASERRVRRALPQAGREAGPQAPLALAPRQPECLGQRNRADRGRGQLPARQEPDALYAVSRHRPLSRNQPEQRGGEVGGDPQDAEDLPA